MSALIFNGIARAAQKEALLSQSVTALKEKDIQPKIAAIVYAEDPDSVLYSRLKKEAAERVGIAYDVYHFSLKERTELVVEKILQLNVDPMVTGIIIQKPSRKIWEATTLVDGEPRSVRQAFQTWWHYQTSQLALEKDVDGLHPETLTAIGANVWLERKMVLPATAKAVVEILVSSYHALHESKPFDQQESQDWRIDGLKLWQGKRALVIGKSDILGLPLAYVLQDAGVKTKLVGRRELQELLTETPELDFDLIISATGQTLLVNGGMIKKGAVVVDVGEPRPDVDLASVAERAAVITPVPGGVGPLTVISLLENAVSLINH